MTGRRVRATAVAGSFYPSDPAALRAALDRAFAGASPRDTTSEGAAIRAPKAIVVPHAGFVYSGPIAATAYRAVAPARGSIRRVVVLGPAHRVYLRGLGLSGADAWASPLGEIALDTDGAKLLADLPFVAVDDAAHEPEHSLEVQVPFVQAVLGDVVLLPLVVGDATADEVAAVLDRVWDDDGTLVVVSTDLSHYETYEVASELDRRTAAAIAARRADDVGDRDACGARPLRGLLRVADERGLTVEQLDLRNSGDTAGDRHRVVGYGAFAVA
jgi:AmmeMemoRadiSam system protein B